MIHETRHKVNLSLLHDCSTFGNSDKLILNKPTGDFFYDPWVILDEYKWSKTRDQILDFYSKKTNIFKGDNL